LKKSPAVTLATAICHRGASIFSLPVGIEAGAAGERKVADKEAGGSAPERKLEGRGNGGYTRLDN